MEIDHSVDRQDQTSKLDSSDGKRVLHTYVKKYDMTNAQSKTTLKMPFLNSVWEKDWINCNKNSQMKNKLFCLFCFEEQNEQIVK